MTNLNPGLQKGYALDFGSPVRYVAEALRAGPQTLEGMAHAYSHDSEELARVWDQELRKPRERRQVKGLQEEREQQAKQWLMERALEALGGQVRREGDRYALTIAFDDLRVGGLPLPGSVTFDEASARGASRPRASSGARRSGRAKAELSGAANERRTTEAKADGDKGTDSEAAEPAMESEVRQWLRANGYTAARLTKALAMERQEVERLLDGSQQAPRVVRLALWALEHGAELPS